MTYFKINHWVSSRILFEKFSIYGANAVRIILILYADDDVHFAGTLVNHIYVDSCFRLGFEKPCRRAHVSRHAVPNGGNQRHILMRVQTIGL